MSVFHEFEQVDASAAGRAIVLHSTRNAREELAPS